MTRQSSVLRHKPVQIWSDISSSSSEGDSPKQQPARIHKRYLNALTSSSDVNMSSYYVTYDRRILCRGAIEVSISSTQDKISVAILKVRDIPIDFVKRASMLIKISVNTSKRNKIQFRSRPMAITSSEITFNETLTFGMEGDIARNRLVIQACLKHDHPLFPDSLGWMSFGLANFIRGGKMLHGLYNLLDRNSGRRKHMLVKDLNYGVLERAISRSTMKTQKSESYIPRLEVKTRPKRQRESTVSLDFTTGRHQRRADQERYVFAVESKPVARRAKKAKLAEPYVIAQDQSSKNRLNSPRQRYEEQTQPDRDLDQEIINNSERRKSGHFQRTAGSFRYLRKRARQISRRRSLIVETSTKPHFESSPSQPDFPSMLSLSSPPACVLHATCPSDVDPWVILSPRCGRPEEGYNPRLGLNEVQCNALPQRKPKTTNSFIEMILEPWKGMKKNEVKSGVHKQEVGGAEPSPFVRRTKNSRKAIKQIGEIFQTREGFGSTRSLYTGGGMNVKTSKTFGRNGFRLSKRKKIDASSLATPMVSRRRKGRFSIGDPTTPNKAHGNLSIIQSPFVDINQDEGNVFDGNQFFKKSDEELKLKSKSRLSLKTWLSKKSESSLKSLSEDKDMTSGSDNKVLNIPLLQVLQCKVGSSKFMKFLKAEFSDENLEFWLEVEVYKQQKKFEKMAIKIYSKYIVNDAPREINIDSSIRDKISHEISRPVRTTFNKAQLHIYNLMEKDSFRRFIRSPTGQTLCDAMTK